MKVLFFFANLTWTIIVVLSLEKNVGIEDYHNKLVCECIPGSISTS